MVEVNKSVGFRRSADFLGSAVAVWETCLLENNERGRTLLGFSAQAIRVSPCHSRLVPAKS
jgi:hypothetical protein